MNPKTHPARVPATRSLLAAFAALGLGASSAIAGTPYNITVLTPQDDPLVQTFHGFGYSQGSGATGGVARDELGDVTYADTQATHLRLFVTSLGTKGTTGFTPPIRTYEDMKAQLVSRYVTNGNIRDLQARGVTMLQLSPGVAQRYGDLPPSTDQECIDFADRLARLVQDMKNEYGIIIRVCGIQNEANTQAWTPSAIRRVAIALRSSLDARGLPDVEVLPTESASNDGTHLGYVREIKNDPVALDSIYGYGSHGYGTNIRDIERWWSGGRHMFINEAAAVGFDGELYDTLASHLMGRLLNDINFGATNWTHFIGHTTYDPDREGYDDVATKMVTLNIKTGQLFRPMKYFYLLPLRKALGNGVRIRRVLLGIDETTGANGGGAGIFTVDNFSALHAAAGVNTDGAWGLVIQNNTGITAPDNVYPNITFGGSKPVAAYAPAADTYDLTVKIKELLATPTKRFNVFRSRVEMVNGTPVPYRFVHSGTATATNGVLTLPNLQPKEIIALREIPSGLPPVPTNLWGQVNYAADGTPSVRIRWEPVPGAATYTVQVKRGATASFFNHGDATDITLNTFTDTRTDRIVVGTSDGAGSANNFYRVRATNLNGSSSYSAELPITVRSGSAATTVAPVAPGGLTARAVSTRQVVLRWVDYATNETGFTVERSPDGSSGWTALDFYGQPLGANKYAASDTGRMSSGGVAAGPGLTPGATYYYRVKATNAAGSSAWFPASGGVAVTLPAAPAAPANLTATGDRGVIQLKWDLPLGPDWLVRVERRAQGESAFEHIDVLRSGAEFYRDLGAQPGVHYTYRVYVLDDAGTASARSNLASAWAEPEPSIIVDNTSPGVSRNGDNWTEETVINDQFGGFIGTSYLRDNTVTSDTARITFPLSVPATGNYDVLMRWPLAAGNAAQAPVTYASAAGVTNLLVNTRYRGGEWVQINSAAVPFNAGSTYNFHWRRAPERFITRVDAVALAKVPAPQVHRISADDTTVASDGTFGASNVQLFAENKGGAWRKVYLRFATDRLKGASGATLRLYTADWSATTTARFTVWGVNQSAGADGWTESGLTWSGAPANNTTSNGITSSATNLGYFDVAAGGAGRLVTFGNAALRDFVNADTDGHVTLILTRDATYNYSNTRFHSKETATAGVTGPTLYITGN